MVRWLEGLSLVNGKPAQQNRGRFDAPLTTLLPVRINFRRVLHRLEELRGRVLSTGFVRETDDWVLTAEVDSRHNGGNTSHMLGTVGGAFTNPYEGPAVLTVYGMGPREARVTGLQSGCSSGAWRFAEADPILWPYEGMGHFVCNRAVDPTAFRRALFSRLTSCPDRWMGQMLGMMAEHGPPCTMGDLPYTLYWAAREALEEMSVPLFVLTEPDPRETPVAFIMGDDQYVVAADFEVELPPAVLPRWLRSETD